MARSYGGRQPGHRAFEAGGVIFKHMGGEGASEEDIRGDNFGTRSSSSEESVSSLSAGGLGRVHLPPLRFCHRPLYPISSDPRSLSAYVFFSAVCSRQSNSNGYSPAPSKPGTEDATGAVYETIRSSFLTLSFEGEKGTVPENCECAGRVEECRKGEDRGEGMLPQLRSSSTWYALAPSALPGG